MACPTVTTTGSATNSDDLEAIKMAIIVARAKASLVCKANGEDCSDVVYIPKHVELVKYKGEFDNNNNPVFAVEVKCTFYCKGKRGCLFFWIPLFAKPNTDIDNEELAKRLLKEETESESS